VGRGREFIGRSVVTGKEGGMERGKEGKKEGGVVND
jgi:hypothetical protein